MAHTIAILGGTGALGSGLAIRWARAGHRIIIGSRTLEKAEEAVTALKALLRELEPSSVCIRVCQLFHEVLIACLE